MAVEEIIRRVVPPVSVWHTTLLELVATLGGKRAVAEAYSLGLLKLVFPDLSERPADSVEFTVKRLWAVWRGNDAPEIALRAEDMGLRVELGSGYVRVMLDEHMEVEVNT